MSKSGTRYVFDDIKKTMDNYCREVDSAYEEYRRSLQQAKTMYNEAHLESERRKYLQTARMSLSSAYHALTTQYQEFGRKELCACMAEYATRPAKPAMLDTLRLYHEFGIEMSRPELDALLHDAVDSYIGLRALAKVAEASNFKLSVPDLGTWEEDVRWIDGVIESAERYVPQGFGEEATAIGTSHYTAQKNIAYAIYNASASITSRIIVDVGLKNFGKRLDEIHDRWTAAFIPSVTVEMERGMTRDEVKEALEAAQDERSKAVKAAADAVTVKDTSNVRLAAEMGRQRADAEQRANAAMSAYQ